MKRQMRMNEGLTMLCALACLVGSFGSACAAPRTSTKPPTYAEHKRDGLTAENREFISDTQERLALITNDMALLRVKLEHESPYVNREQRAEWIQELFELGQRRDRVRGELTRAQTASAAEWEQIREPLVVATDSLQARVSQMGAVLAGDIQVAQRDASATTSPTGICPLYVRGAEAEVRREARTVVVSITTDRADSVPGLQTRAQDMTRVGTYPAEQDRAIDRGEAPFATEDTPTQGAPPLLPASNGGTQALDVIPVKITAQNVPDGVRLTFAPNDTHLDSLETRLENDSERMAQGLCEASPEVGLNNTSNK